MVKSVVEYQKETALHQFPFKYSSNPTPLPGESFLMSNLHPSLQWLELCRKEGIAFHSQHGDPVGSGVSW